MKFIANWITTNGDIGAICAVYRRKWSKKNQIKKATAFISSLGVYEAFINGERISEYVLAPGWTCYDKRLQYQEYDITNALREDNELLITVGKGWFSSPMPGWMETDDKTRRKGLKNALICELHIEYLDGSSECIASDTDWEWSESPIRFSEIYDGETFDASFTDYNWNQVSIHEWPRDIIIPQEGEIIKEQEVLPAKEIIITPAGERVIDFGQEITGYVEFTIDGKRGDAVKILHGEVLDKDGNFYNDNYRSAKAEVNYICKAGRQTYHPRLTFFGFRFIKLENFPEEIKLSNFRAIAVYSDIKRTGSLHCSSEKLNQLFSNIFWGQKGNFLDVPTDCPQRDERLGWTGDAQAFVKTASYNFDVEKFFRKWLRDLSTDQYENGAIPDVIPDYIKDGHISTAWGDAATICPWQIYVTYGNKDVLAEQFPSMKGWVDYISGVTKDKYLWTGGEHFGDWLGLDAPSGSYKGSSREDLVASAFYYYSASLLVKAGRVLGKDISEYEQLCQNIKTQFQEVFPEYNTQTEYTLAIYFGLAIDIQKAADELSQMVKENGFKLQTGFVGTPYLLHTLSRHGHSQVAYQLLVQEEYPSWLYSVNKGATTIWEHWDGIMEDGQFWSTDMNSFNHYAYGAVADWVYEEAAGIKPVESSPGFAEIIIEPKPSKTLDYLEASIETRHGLVSSRWKWQDNLIHYDIKVPVKSTIIITGTKHSVEPGEYSFTAESEK